MTLDLAQITPGTVCPGDLHPLPPVAETSAEGVALAVQRARAAQVGWATRSAAEREVAVLAIARRMLERREEGAKTLSEETGRSPLECLMSELASIGEFAKGAIRASRVALAKEPIALGMLDYPGKKAYIEAVPRGVIGVIAPWNYPVGNLMKSLFPALLAGNGVVIKPSEHTPRSALWLGDVCREVLPEGLVQVVTGDGALGKTLLESGISAIVFTGSVPTGRKVAARAGELLIPCSAELGGKDAAIVLADCDLDRTALGIAQWSFHNAGQNCAAIERVYVEASIADAFVERLGRIAKKLRVAPADGPTDLGPLQNPHQLAIVERHVNDAVARGAVVVAGGARTGPGLGYQATVLDHCTQDLAVVQEETFGPVVAVVRVADAEEAVRLANDSKYGLNGSVWTRDTARGEALARRLEVGVALVNNHSFVGIVPELPWTGTKETGFGVANSRHAYPTFVRRRAVLIDRSKQPDPWWMPADASLAAFSEALVIRQTTSFFGGLLKLAGLVGKRVKAIQSGLT